MSVTIRVKVKFRSIDGVKMKQLPSLFSSTYGHGFICLLSFLFGVINVVDYFYVCIIL